MRHHPGKRYGRSLALSSRLPALVRSVSPNGADEFCERARRERPGGLPGERRGAPPSRGDRGQTLAWPAGPAVAEWHWERVSTTIAGAVAPCRGRPRRPPGYWTPSKASSSRSGYKCFSLQDHSFWSPRRAYEPLRPWGGVTTLPARGCAVTPRDVPMIRHSPHCRSQK